MGQREGFLGIGFERVYSIRVWDEFVIRHDRRGGDAQGAVLAGDFINMRAHVALCRRTAGEVADFSVVDMVGKARNRIGGQAVVGPLAYGTNRPVNGGVLVARRGVDHGNVERTGTRQTDCRHVVNA